MPEVPDQFIVKSIDLGQPEPEVDDNIVTRAVFIENPEAWSAHVIRLAAARHHTSVGPIEYPVLAIPTQIAVDDKVYVNFSFIGRSDIQKLVGIRR